MTDDRACSVPQSFAVAIGDQIRLTRNPTEYALFTVAQKHHEDEPDRVRMGLGARLRLGAVGEFPATLTSPVVAPGLTDAQAQAASEFVERLVDDAGNTRLVTLAPHGGTIEFGTDLQAEVVANALGASSWLCKGWSAGGNAHRRWHITSTALSPYSFPGLAQIADRGFTHAVSFHGMTTGGVLIGGAAPLELRQMVRAAILDALSDPTIPVAVVAPGNPFDGDSPANLVNWMTAGGVGGVQIEQGPGVRLDHAYEVAMAVADVFANLV